MNNHQESPVQQPQSIIHLKEVSGVFLNNYQNYLDIRNFEKEGHQIDLLVRFNQISCLEIAKQHYQEEQFQQGAGFAYKAQKMVQIFSLSMRNIFQMNFSHFGFGILQNLFSVLDVIYEYQTQNEINKDIIRLSNNPFLMYTVAKYISDDQILGNIEVEIQTQMFTILNLSSLPEDAYTSA